MFFGIHTPNIVKFCCYVSCKTSAFLVEVPVLVQQLFLIFKFHKVVWQHSSGEVEISMTIHGQFPHESVSERYLKIGLHLQKLWRKIKCTTFCWTWCSVMISCYPTVPVSARYLPDVPQNVVSVGFKETKFSTFSCFVVLEWTV